MKEFDIKTGKWGPYNKDYLGLCYIADQQNGGTFQFELFPGFYKRTIIANRILQDSGVKIFGANKDLTNFTYRYEIEWKDRVYCDSTFHIQNDKEVLVECKFVNNTNIAQNVWLNACFSLNYPTKKWWAFVKGHRKIAEPVLGRGMKYIDAIQYADINCAMDLANKGFYLAEELIDCASNKGTAISEKYFGGERSHYLKYEFEKLNANSIGIRYKAEKETSIYYLIGEKRIEQKLKECQEFEYAIFPIEEQELNTFTVYASEGKITIDSFVVGIDVFHAKFQQKKINVEAQLEKDFVSFYGAFGSRKVEGNDAHNVKKDNTLYISYEGIDTNFSISWDAPHRRLCRYYTDDINILLNQNLHCEYHTIEEGRPTDRVYDDIIFAPIELQPNSEQKIRFTIRCGNLSELKNTKVDIKQQERYQVEYNQDGQKYAFSQNLMSYTTLLNIVYPMYVRGEYSKQYVPGRLWDCLYTWDNGFIGMGLATIDFDRAYECLTSYLTLEGDKHSPFIMSGSIVPTQILLYGYLFNQFERYEDLKKLYPMVKQYYTFFGDLRKDKHQMKSGLLKLWHLNYNSGGWDDYPPQLALTHWEYDKPVLDGATIDNTTPVITTAITVLVAKIMKNIATLLGYKEDIARYQNDIDYYSESIQKNCYDEESGYYQYVVHNENGEPKTFFKYHNGELFGSGFDGIYPYIAGISTKEQSQKIISNIKCGMLTPYGLSSIDMRASYYSQAGYWNGNIWFPHQWILWNTLLDKGETQLATKVAYLAMDVWERECNETYNCMENFSIKTGRGAGYHQFSGLSTPLLMWFKSYFTPNTVSCGFLTMVFDKKFNQNGEIIEFSYTTQENNTCILICLNENKTYSFYLDDQPVCVEKATNGSYYLRLDKKAGRVRIGKE